MSTQPTNPAPIDEPQTTDTGNGNPPPKKPPTENPEKTVPNEGDAA